MAPILDARAEAQSSRSIAHVEEVGGSTCPRVHSLSECQTCRTLGSGALASPLAQLSPLAARTDGQLRRTAVASPQAGQFGPLGSRAPPPR